MIKRHRDLFDIALSSNESHVESVSLFEPFYDPRVYLSRRLVIHNPHNFLIDYQNQPPTNSFFLHDIALDNLALVAPVSLFRAYTTFYPSVFPLHLASGESVTFLVPCQLIQTFATFKQSQASQVQSFIYELEIWL